MPECNCGSGYDREEQLDGYGIFLTYTCPACEKDKMAGFRSDIREHYICDEPIEEDE